MEWENVSKQIAGTIAGMLTARAHDKIRSVFQYQWSDAIKQGNVQKVITMIRNGLISKAAQIREFDKSLFLAFLVPLHYTAIFFVDSPFL